MGSIENPVKCAPLHGLQAGRPETVRVGTGANEAESAAYTVQLCVPKCVGSAAVGQKRKGVGYGFWGRERLLLKAVSCSSCTSTPSGVCTTLQQKVCCKLLGEKFYSAARVKNTAVSRYSNTFVRVRVRVFEYEYSNTGITWYEVLEYGVLEY